MNRYGHHRHRKLVLLSVAIAAATRPAADAAELPATDASLIA